MKDLKERIEAVYKRANNLSGGNLDIIKTAILSFNDARATEAAASIAYFTFFSIFPLLLFTVAAGSYFLDSAETYQAVVGVMTERLPVSQELIEENIQQVIEMRGTMGLVAIIGLLWSSMGVFLTLEHNVSRAWPEASERDLVMQHLVALAIVGVLSGLLSLSLISNILADLLPRFHVPLWGGISAYETPLWQVLSGLVPWLSTFLLFLALYRWVPNVEVRWSEAFWGALVAAFAWKVAASGFSWYVSSGLARYELMYGSLGTVVALMFWIYISSLIVLFGAHLSAAVAGRASSRLDARSHGPG